MSQDKHVNPFPNDPDRHAIWEILMRRDFDAFLAQDWSITGPDFVDEGFFGIDAGQRANPDHWALKYPTLDLYREEWLKQAGAFKDVTLAAEEKRDFLFRAITLRDIDIAGDHAVAHKKFDGSAQTNDGQSISLKWQTLYQMRRQNGSWKIASFVGYMPHPMPTHSNVDTQEPAIQMPPSATQHRKAGPYSPVLRIQPGETVAIAGQGPQDMDGNIIGTTIAEQSRIMLENCKQKLEEAGATMDDVFKVMIYLDDMSEWGEFNEVYKQFFSPPYPVRTAIGCRLWGGMKVEADMLARRG